MKDHECAAKSLLVPIVDDDAVERITPLLAADCNFKVSGTHWSLAL
jgi:hypothetical protein